MFSDLLMFFKIFLSPHVKRSAVISNKHGIYEHGFIISLIKTSSAYKDCFIKIPIFPMANFKLIFKEL